MMRSENETGDPYIGLLLEARYRLEELIGRGGMGAVFRGTDERLRREVAVKVIQAGDLSGDELARHRQRFTREAQLAARIQDPNVVAIHDYGTHVDSRTGRALDFIVMDLLRGESLAEWMPRLSRTELSTAFSLLMQTAAGVAAGHVRGVVHRDIKPRNVLVVPAKAGRLWARVVDFGIAKPLHDDGTFGEITVGPGFVGTASYASPEQLEGRVAPGPASDVFSLGLLAYELFTGTLPFTEKDRNRLSQGLFVHLRPPRVLNPLVPPPLEAVVLRALAVDPAQRFDDADAFASALDEAWERGMAEGFAEPGTLTSADATLPALETAPHPGATPLPRTQPERGASLLPEPPVAENAVVEPPSEGPPAHPQVQLPPNVPADPEGTPAGVLPVDPGPSRRSGDTLPSGTPQSSQPAPPRSRLRRAARQFGVWAPAAAFAAAMVASAASDIPINVLLTAPFTRHVTRELTPGLPVAGEIGPGDRKSETGARFDTYQYRGTATGPVVATVEAYGFRASIEWSRMVDGRWQVLESSGWTEHPWISVAAEDSGEYQVRVQSQYSASAGSYMLTVAPRAPELQGGTAFASTLSGADLSLAGGDYAEQWTYRGGPGEQVTVTLDSTSTARLEWGRVVGGDWMPLEEGGSPLTAILADSGEYVVRVRNRQTGSARMPYTISLATGPQRIFSDQSRAGRLSAADSHRDGQAYETWSYRGVPNQPVTFTVRDEDGAGVGLELGRVVGGRWETLETSVSSGGAVAELNAAVDTAAYQLRVLTERQGSGGSYELSTSTRSRSIAPGQIRRSMLSGADPLNPQNRYHEVWLLRGTPGQWLQITATGATGLGSYGVGFGRIVNGSWVAYGIGGSADGGGTATLFVQPPDAGEFIIVVAKSTPTPDAYSLSVQRWP